MKNKIIAIIITVFSIGSCVPSSAHSQSTNVILNDRQQQTIIEDLSQKLLTHYVVKSEAKTLAKVLRSAIQDEAYSSPKTIEDFVNQTNQLMQNTVGDKHLALLEPVKFKRVMEMFYDDVNEQDSYQRNPLGEQPNNQKNHHRSHQSRNKESSGNPLSVVGVSNVAEISRDGLNQTGYLALERFDASKRSVDFMQQVFGTFTESDNIIIDLRNCNGGDAKMVKILSSYFFDEPTHLLDTSMPDENNAKITVERWTEPNELSSNFADKPLKVLISNNSFSAAESFAFGLQAAGRAELVGGTTAGGGYTNDFFSLPYHLGVSISVGRTYDFRTGKGWQAAGVIPDVNVDATHALHTALTSFTEQSGKLANLKGDNKEVYQVVQAFTNAWYGADVQTMKGLLNKGFVREYMDPNGAMLCSISGKQLLVETKRGDGTRKNKIYYNRIIRNIHILGDQAMADLILRETTHKLVLVKVEGKWLLSQDTYKDKFRS